MSDRVAKRRGPRRRFWYFRQEGQALVETALVIPLLLLLAVGVVAVGRVIQAQMGISAVVRETARVAALANDEGEAVDRGTVRGQEVAAGYNLSNGSLQLTVEPGEIGRGTPVLATARYEITLGDLPLLGWAHLSLAVSHIERTDLYRSRR